MKHLAYLFLVSALFSGCHFLEQTSPNDLDADLVFTTPESAENALIGCYASLQSHDYLGGDFLLLPDACTDDVATGGYDLAPLDEFEVDAVTPANLYVGQTWTAIYRTIANCNRLLDGLQKIPSSDFAAGQKQRIEGEARTIRAMAHFDLLRLFGEHWDLASPFGVPIVAAVLPYSTPTPRSSVAATYDFILNELEAARLLVKTDSHDANFLDRSVVDALRARVYLYKKEFVAAAYAVLAVKNTGFYTLSDASPIYSLRKTPESIFELGFDISSQSGFNSLTFGSEKSLRPELFFLADHSLKPFFETRTGDSRAKLLDFQHNDVSIQPDGRTQKYRGETTKDNPAYVIRFAEILLIEAEARFHINGISEGLKSLNAVRTARGLGPIAESQVPDNQAFIKILLDERRAELNFEGHRFFDLARLGAFSETMGAEAFRAILPIPLHEISASGGVVVQNPSY